MSSRREVFIRIQALLQRKTFIETKNHKLKCLKRHYSTVRSMKNIAVLTEDGAFALFFRPHPGGFDSSRVPTPRNLSAKEKKKANAWGLTRGGGGVGVGRSWNWLHKNLVKSVPWQDLPAFQSNHLSDASILGLSLLPLPKVAYYATNNPNHVFSPKFS